MIVNPERNDWEVLATRPAMDQKDLSVIIREVFRSISERGDQAAIEYTTKFDGAEIRNLKVSQNAEEIDIELAAAIQRAKENIDKFHSAQQLKVDKIETSPGVVCWQESRAIDSVGLYIPGGTAPLFSTVLMLAVPAMIAGCKEIILCTPPNSHGEINPIIAYAAKLCGITQIFRLGGAQAIAAMSIGTESIPKVQKIFGPGNQYVTAAKQFALSMGTAIDMPAGPSELLVIASEKANPAYVASDLLSQAEHGIDSQVICLAQSIEKLTNIKKEIDIQLEKLPRKEIASKALANSKFIAFHKEEDLIDFSNLYAPEHLIIADDHSESYVHKINNAGSVFLGNYCPESAGDYASGTNHTLPTAGFAKMYSGVNLDSFVKKITFQKISKEGIMDLGRTIEILAEAEGLHAHKNAVSLRLNDLRAEK